MHGFQVDRTFNIGVGTFFYKQVFIRIHLRIWLFNIFWFLHEIFINWHILKFLTILRKQNNAACNDYLTILPKIFISFKAFATLSHLFINITQSCFKKCLTSYVHLFDYLIKHIHFFKGVKKPLWWSLSKVNMLRRNDFFYENTDSEL